MAVKINGTTVVDNSRNIVNALNGTFSGEVFAYSFTGAGAIPIGMIAMWSGTIANIPAYWYLCDGSNGTPDLRNRFIVGAHSGTGNGTSATTGPGFSGLTGTLNSDYTPGNIGGSTAHRLTIAQLPAHTHEVTDDDGGWNTGTSNNLCRATNLGTIQKTTTSTGSNFYHENRPPYYALAFIMFGGIIVSLPATP